MTAGIDDTTSHPPRSDASLTRFPLASLLSRSGHAMLALDGEGRIAAANARAEALLNRGLEGLHGQPFSSLLRPQDRAVFEHALHQSLRAGEAQPDLDLMLERAPGGDAMVGITFLPLGETAPRVALLLRDLQAERERRDHATRGEADDYRAAKQENRKMADLGKLIAGVTHEFRTPLTWLNNTLTLQRARLDALAAQRPDVAPTLQEIVDQNETMQDGADRLIHLVHELRPLSKNRPYMPVPTDLAEVVMSAVKAFRGTHEGKVRVELDLQATHRVLMDREDMCNVVLNLLNNAADAMRDEGVVRVVTRNVHTPPEIRVIDHGPGVHPRFLPHLFEPFQTTKAEGTGLGLFISQRTVEAHGGTLTYEPTPGGGATFVVRFHDYRPG